MKKEIKTGHTNKVKYVEDGKFTIEKTLNGFNHKIDYSVLEEFDFVPKLISNDSKQVVWEYVEGEMVSKPTNDDLIQIATILRKVHKSDIKLPSNNLRRRVNEYLRIIHEKGLRPVAVENYYREGLKIMNNMNMINATHNDVWFENLIKTPEGKIFLVDWEYATMGDKHFDLAFYISSARLNKEQEALFLETYDSFDDYQTYDQKLVDMYKRFVAYVTICWAYAQDKMPFDVSNLEKTLLSK